jgi:RimJ/RimL family protein N-acetyltransferase
MMKIEIKDRTIQTDRLLLRPWIEEDFEPLIALYSNPRVMEFALAVKDRHESERDFLAMSQHMEKYGFGFWTVSLIQTNTFIGLIGLENVCFEAPFKPAVEIGWRLSTEYWGKGYATEGAFASLKYGFDVVQLNEIVAFTQVHNYRSRKVMERIGMHYDPRDDFDDVECPEGHPLRQNVLYRISKEQWRQACCC